MLNKVLAGYKIQNTETTANHLVYMEDLKLICSSHIQMDFGLDRGSQINFVFCPLRINYFLSPPFVHLHKNHYNLKLNLLLWNILAENKNSF